ncbi:hypothetical protein [Chryseobacterium sp.]|uniref:hypothetical protein n=1 Tax=Chryseobacterium sp. TaxID=1871047 RepID=UPI0011CBFE58|nr:hypothetical protein [Chryseobacterium sp.]TXF76001.1 hypothetical protein FUA25_08875 [Chryseobacterium sp.]
MKTVFLLFLSMGSLMFSQKLTSDNWKRMSENERKELIKKMTPEERKELLKEFREKMMISELEVTKENEEEFRDLYTEYQESQKQIKNKFTPKETYDKLSEEEAKAELERSFEIGQQLLDNRKKYSQKFQRLIKPQQVLELFQTEGKMRERVNERQNNIRTPNESSSFRSRSAPGGFRSTKRP